MPLNIVHYTCWERFYAAGDRVVVSLFLLPFNLFHFPVWYIEFRTEIIRVKV